MVAKKKKIELDINLILASGTLLVFAIILGFFYYQIRIVVPSGTNLADNNNQQALDNQPQSEQIRDIDRSNSTVYKNDKLGFQFAHPESLDEDIPELIAQREEYYEDCEAGRRENCDFSPWPDYAATYFLEDQEILLVAIEMHLTSEVNYLSAFNEKETFAGISPASKNAEEEPFIEYGVVRDGYTYIFGAPISINYSKEDLKNIASTFEFIEPEKPLTCLWFPDYISVEDLSDVENPEAYSPDSGFYYDQEQNECLEIERYLESGVSIPFSTAAECQSVCLE